MHRLTLCGLVLLAGCEAEPRSAEDGGTEGDSAEDTGTDGDTGTTGELPEPLPPLDSVPLTTEERMVPTHAVETEPTMDPRVPDQIEQLLMDGYGDMESVDGEPVIPLTLDGMDPPAPGANPRLLARFVHLADVQLTDDESPARVAHLDNTELFSAGFRPQEGHGCAILNAATRTINAVHGATPLDFVLLGGDNIDNAQTNELQWFQAILDGAPAVHCDSGDDDDPEPGPDNDIKDRFAPVGLDVPWWWVTGNHDILYQGNRKLQDVGSLATGSDADGTRDWSMPGGPITEDEIPADSRRKQIGRASIFEILREDGDVNGIDDDVVTYGKAYYAFDAGEDLRIVVVDTAAETGSASGVIHQADVDALLRPALDDAMDEGKLVIVTGHHASLSDGGDLFGTVQPDAITTEEWEGVLGEYDHVLMYLAGHSHANVVDPVMPPGGSAYWQMRTAAIADFPHQMRLIEVHDQDNGFVTITGIALDFSTEDDPLAADGRARGVTDYTAAWITDGSGEPEDRNVQLWVPKP